MTFIKISSDIEKLADFLIIDLNYCKVSYWNIFLYVNVFLCCAGTVKFWGKIEVSKLCLVYTSSIQILWQIYQWPKPVCILLFKFHCKVAETVKKEWSYNLLYWSTFVYLPPVMDKFVLWLVWRSKFHRLSGSNALIYFWIFLFGLIGALQLLYWWCLNLLLCDFLE